MLNDSKANKVFMLALVLVIALVTSIQYSGNKKDLANRNEETFSLNKSDSLEITTISNDISLEIDPKAKQASASFGGGKTASLSVEKIGTKVSIKVSTIKRGFFSFSPTNTSRLVIIIPERYLARLSITTVSGDIDIMKDIAAETIAVKTISGNIDALNLNAENSVSIATVSGQISCYSIKSENKASIATTSGQIDINEVQGADIELRTISSDIEATARVKAGGEIKTSSTSGEIQLDLRGNENLSVTAGSTSGDIQVHAKDQETHSFSDKTGTGVTQVSAKTISGAIKLLY
ncbi:hypothetical protein SpiGrapes_2048 [Sphaerochaeta pleomorpha str. Grapes]|uniref:DUF4097 domain-containing protein n=1 Tax=Sphaerochaeta pleomorpha (strain ATCC BAA-1885 / DSM 22778 / Grapes) TaxID=158190 RepID=G8QQY7_SPHPG|nr:DUF4097 family beta strand repeat-containing protein [Sphaerochaeta pleomorpha]AEV29835.1 hypothetical protein SpiGrapes_2048 [Sphaerochaeta pleomorpha str. Grapes]